ncbi:MAG TPA: hypothetical protein VH372_16650 [Actinospica sp.]|jgi:hypothetical protein|nr:hypothetical protein [Actinospica sp.]
MNITDENGLMAGVLELIVQSHGGRVRKVRVATGQSVRLGRGLADA